MIWLKSATQKEWVINGRVIPKYNTPDNRYLQVSESDYNQMLGKPVFKSLVNAGGIIITHTQPVEVKNSVASLQINISELKTENDTLRKENEALKKDVDKIKEEAVAELKAEAIAELESMKKQRDEALAENESLTKQLNEALAENESLKKKKSKSE